MTVANGPQHAAGGQAAGGRQNPGGAARRNSKVRRSLVLGGAALAGTAVLGARLWQLQVIESDRYRAQAVRNRSRTEPVRPVRGIIYDRDREPLVRNVPVFGVWVTPADVPAEREGAVLGTLAALTGERLEDLRFRLELARRDPGQPARLARSIPRESALVIEKGSASGGY